MQQRGYFPQVEYFNDVECTATPVQPMVVSENKGKESSIILTPYNSVNSNKFFFSNEPFWFFFMQSAEAVGQRCPVKKVS